MTQRVHSDSSCFSTCKALASSSKCVLCARVCVSVCVSMCVCVSVCVRRCSFPGVRGRGVVECHTFSTLSHS